MVQSPRAILMRLGCFTAYSCGDICHHVHESGIYLTMSLRCALIVLLSLGFVGCGQGMTDQQRLEIAFGGPLNTVVPVGGTIRVNGKPEPGVFVGLHSEEGSNPIKVRAPATDEDGNFQFTTYLQGDGIEPGTYRLTFQWLRIERRKKEGLRTTGPDLLNKAYNDPKKSQFTIVVEEGVPQTDLEFDLKTTR